MFSNRGVPRRSSSRSGAADTPESRAMLVGSSSSSHFVTPPSPGLWAAVVNPSEDAESSSMNEIRSLG